LRRGLEKQVHGLVDIELGGEEETGGHGRFQTGEAERKKRGYGLCELIVRPAQ
jgi:hypothetical protein